jgi:hypothetical protein
VVESDKNIIFKGFLVDELHNDRILKESYWINQLKYNFEGILVDELDNNRILK